MKSIDTTFDPDTLASILAERLGIGAGAHLKVAFSGGLDSHTLLHALSRLRVTAGWTLSAIHVHHGLQPGADAWAEHCREVCAALQVPWALERVPIPRAPDEGIEAAARRARYAALARHVVDDDVLLTAHHMDDQAETVLLQLLRGAGVHGLAAMPAIAPFGAGRLARPLLGFRRRALESYARAQRLSWIEDTSNRDERLTRNYLRRQIMPRLEHRWPQAARQLARAARNAADAAHLLDELAQADLAACRGAGELELSVAALGTLSPVRQRALIRYWLRCHGQRPPTGVALAQILVQLRRAPRSGHAAIPLAGAEVRRYRDRLVLWRYTRPPGWSEIAWDAVQPLVLPGTGLRVRAVPTVGAGLSRARIAGRRLFVRRRCGGESLRLPGRAHRHKLKKLLQQSGVSPWERAVMPLIYVDDELAAVGDRWVCEPFAARGGEAALTFVLEATIE